jgi:hypothetical protein
VHPLDGNAAGPEDKLDGEDFQLLLHICFLVKKAGGINMTTPMFLFLYVLLLRYQIELEP